MLVSKLSAADLCGSIAVPSSKSVAHRALICAAFAHGSSTITDAGISQDVEATLQALRQMGAMLRREENRVLVSPGTPAAAALTVDCAESGSTLRFLIPVAATLGMDATFTGRGRLPERPLGPYRDLMEGRLLFELSGGRLPLHIRGRLTGGRFQLPGDVSSQFVTGLMLAAPLMQDPVCIHLTTPLGSAPYLDITRCVMADFGVETTVSGNEICVAGGQGYRAASYRVEGDWSQAAFWLAAGALSGPVTVQNVRANSPQGDRRIVSLLAEFGAGVSQQEQSVTVRRAPLHGISVDVEDIPDLVPILAVVAACAEGKTLLYNAARLRLKESDRLAAMAHNLRLLGVEVEERPDALCITGSPAGFAGGIAADGCNDHRIVMAMAIAALRCRRALTVSTPQAIEKSYPQFFADYQTLGGHVDGIDLGQ